MAEHPAGLCTRTSRARTPVVAVALLVVGACGASPDVARTRAAAPPAPSPTLGDGGTPGGAGAAPVVALVRAPESPAPEPADALDGGAHAGLNLHARRAPVMVDDGLVALGSGTPPAWPRGPTVEIGPTTSFPAMGGVAAVVASLRSGFRRCYARALQSDPNLAGAVVIGVTLGPGGEVVGVKTSGGAGLPAEMVSCIAAVLRHAPFEAPPGGSATLMIPFTLTR